MGLHRGPDLLGVETREPPMSNPDWMLGWPMYGHRFLHLCACCGKQIEFGSYVFDEELEKLPPVSAIKFPFSEDNCPMCALRGFYGERLDAERARVTALTEALETIRGAGSSNGKPVTQAAKVADAALSLRRSGDSNG